VRKSLTLRGGYSDMGLDFSKSSKVPEPQEEPKDELVVQQYDIVADRQQMNHEWTNSAEVDALVSTIEIDNMETIVTFGAHAADLKGVGCRVKQHESGTARRVESDARRTCKDHGQIRY
jgi:hypothetical protein